MPLPGRCHHSEHRTDEHKRQDILIYLLLWFARSDIEVSQSGLQRVWPIYLELLEKQGIRVSGFYRDVVTKEYEELGIALRVLHDFGFVDLDRRVYPKITPSEASKFRRDADQTELKAVWEVAPIVYSYYRRGITFEEYEENKKRGTVSATK